MNTSFTLFRLQSQDTLRMKMNSRLKEIDRIIAADKDISRANKELAEAKLVEAAAETVVKTFTAQVKEKKLKRELTQANLFSGKVRNPKELQDLQAETHALDRAIAKLEEDQLQAMMAHEEAEKIACIAEEELQKVMNRKSSQNALLLGEKHKIESDIIPLDAQRQALRDQLDVATFTIYRNLLREKAGRAVAEIADDTCGACGVTVPPADIQAAKSPNVIAYCKNCGRILYKS